MGEAMSNRTSEANQAIADAWAREKRLVQQGKGTCDWAPQQQQDIVTRGKAYDMDGKAYEGHHMKSVQAYPEYQGKSGNIQFLSREEHLAAHNGNYQNPTNGHYNTSTGRTKSFEKERLVPCKAQKLSEPIYEKGVSKDIQSHREINAPTNMSDVGTKPKSQDMQSELKSSSTKEATQLEEYGISM